MLNLVFLTIISAATNAVSLPECVGEAKEIQAILAKMKKNSTSKFKYDGYRYRLSLDSDVVLTARLIYAETLAANCPENSDEVMTHISFVIANRIRIRKEDAKSVIFERDQFASSLNNYSSSKYLDFLCPKDDELWQKALTFAETKSVLLPAWTVNYFLYKHHPGWTKEPWSLSESKISQASKTRTCLRLFDNPRWN